MTVAYKAILLPVKNLGVKFSLRTSIDCQVLPDNSKPIQLKYYLKSPTGFIFAPVKAFIGLIPTAEVCFVNVGTWHLKDHKNAHLSDLRI